MCKHPTLKWQSKAELTEVDQTEASKSDIKNTDEKDELSTVKVLVDDSEGEVGDKSTSTRQKTAKKKDKAKAAKRKTVPKHKKAKTEAKAEVEAKASESENNSELEDPERDLDSVLEERNWSLTFRNNYLYINWKSHGEKHNKSWRMLHPQLQRKCFLTSASFQALKQRARKSQLK